MHACATLLCGWLQAYVVHATFQRHHTAGKRARMREEGLWLPEPSDYFHADRLLAYSNGVRGHVAALEASSTDGSAAGSAQMPDLLKHFHAMSYQLAALRDAFGMARALNRTLVCTTTRSFGTSSAIVVQYFTPVHAYVQQPCGCDAVTPPSVRRLSQPLQSPP